MYIYVYDKFEFMSSFYDNYLIIIYCFQAKTILYFSSQFVLVESMRIIEFLYGLRIKFAHKLLLKY